MSIFNLMRKHIESLYDSTFTITECVFVKNVETGIDEATEIVTAENVPCRISFKSSPATRQTDTGATLTQSIVLFTYPEVAIKAGSKIIAVINGEEVIYKASGEPTKHKSHQEVELVIDKEWA